MSAMDFVTVKMTHYFNLLDADGDGFLTEEDHVLMGRRAAKEFSYPSGSSQEQQLIDAYRSAWKGVQLPHADQEGRVDQDSFLTAIRSLFARPEFFEEVSGALIDSVMSLADIDGDGVIQPSEYAGFILAQSPKMSRADIEESFLRLDRDGNGVIDKSELERATIEYFTSNDPDAAGNWLYGRPPAAV
ncbi:EF-hand domain-containing protein [Streptomyces sp. NPDC090022]|uniref:EF-hand domain-containing protein n=1 Tax=Streptomyces sp. NPDC090022 TaxID=3365920 RepID=UPI003814317F